MIVSLVLLGWAALGIAAPEDPDNPLLPALQGKLQCYSPDVSRKTCQSLAGYVPDGHGGYRNTAEVLLARAPRLTLETVSSVTIKSGAVCGFVRKADIDSGTVKREGVLLTGDVAQRLRDAVWGVFAPMADKEICTRYVAGGAQWTAWITIDGAVGKLPEQAVIWVSPDEGYRVAG